MPKAMVAWSLMFMVLGNGADFDTHANYLMRHLGRE